MMAHNVVESHSDLLVQAFGSFNDASSSLEKAYLDLQARVGHLSKQLEKSNYYLNSVLQNLPCGVIVIDQNKQVTSLNCMARKLFSVGADEVPMPLETLLSEASFSERAALFNESMADTTEIERNHGTRQILQCSWSRMRNGERILVVQDVTQMRDLEEQMQASERLAAKGELALEVAHEIRNPLGALELFASLVAEEDLTGEERRRYLTNMQIGIRSLNAVLTNMLCFARKSTPEKGRVVVGDIVEEAVSFMKPLLDQRGIELRLQRSDSVELELDPDMFRQVLTNLTTNAVRALPEGGLLDVRVHRNDGLCLVSVGDNGNGIPNEYRQSIFQSGFTTSRDGNGLGLAIVQRFVEAHGGSVVVESEQGRGTVVTLSFPVEVDGV